MLPSGEGALAREVNAAAAELQQRLSDLSPFTDSPADAGAKSRLRSSPNISHIHAPSFISNNASPRHSVGPSSVPTTPFHGAGPAWDMGQATLTTSRSGGGAPCNLTGVSRCPVGPAISAKLSKLLSTTVNFRDVNLVSTVVPRADSPDGVEDVSLVTGVQKNKLIIIMVGLPARGKTFLCTKIMRYLNWLGHETRHFNVGAYRRRHKAAEESDPHHTPHDADFFDHNNQVGMDARMKALNAALDDLVAWLQSDNSQVAILDGTNSTEERRKYLRQCFHGKWQYLMIETVCSDPQVLHENYMMKMRYSPDYKGVDVKQALEDFKARIKKYEDVYETITDRTYHYIRLTDILTGRGHMDLNRISGYLGGKLVQFLMQVCRSGGVRKIFLTRHGESEYNKLELLGGDSHISEKGQKYAALLPAALLSRLPQGERVSLSVWTSTLKRTIETAHHLPFPKLQWKALDEIDAGACDGMTYEQIAKEMPEEYAARKKDKLRYRYPEGESYLDVVQRLEPVIMEMEREREYVCIVSHQAVLRVVYGYFMGIPQEDIPSLEIPLHTLIELTPLPEGSMYEQRFAIDITRGEEQFTGLSEGEARPGSPGSETSETIAACGPAGVKGPADVANTPVVAATM